MCTPVVQKQLHPHLGMLCLCRGAEVGAARMMQELARLYPGIVIVLSDYRLGLYLADQNNHLAIASSSWHAVLVE
jgi:hypothetical protein